MGRRTREDGIHERRFRRAVARAALASLGVCVAFGPPSRARAGDDPIQDNSFLLEEAYNQEPGVVQHIGAYTRSREGGAWSYAFTQEWPLGGQAHQLSFTLPVLRTGVAGSGIGDLALNYRYQLLGSGETAVAMAPRLSLVLPTGNVRGERGAGGLGLQVNLPVSVTLGNAWVAHVNLGSTRVRLAEDSQGDETDVTAWNVGQSFVWLARPRLNVLAELTYTRAEVVTGPGATERVETFFVSPGVRWAHDFQSGLQIVPGIAAPFGVGPSHGDRLVFLYLSFEHPFPRARPGAAPESNRGVSQYP